MGIEPDATPKGSSSKHKVERKGRRKREKGEDVRVDATRGSSVPKLPQPVLSVE